MADNKKPSFFGSMMDATVGYIKGTLAGGAIGLVAGLAIGAAVGVLTGGIGAAALLGAGWGAGIMASIGAIAGATTEVIKGREAVQPSANDMARVAKASFMEGLATGQHIAQSQSQEAEQTKFRERELERRANLAMQSNQIH